jgi:tRNA U55 pseudouridine synthase TruB
LRRVASGAFTAPACVAMDTLIDKRSIERAVVSPDHAVLDRPAVVLSAREARAVRMGQSIRLSTMEAPSPPAPFQPGTPPQARVTHASGWRRGERGASRNDLPLLCSPSPELRERGLGGEGAVRLYSTSGTLIALARLSNGLVKPFRVFDGGSELDADDL